MCKLYWALTHVLGYIMLYIICYYMIIRTYFLVFYYGTLSFT